MPHSIHSPVESGTRLPIPWPALGPSQETGCLWPGSPQAGSESGVGEPASALLEEKKEPQARLTSPQQTLCAGVQAREPPEPMFLPARPQCHASKLTCGVKRLRLGSQGGVGEWQWEHPASRHVGNTGSLGLASNPALQRHSPRPPMAWAVAQDSSPGVSAALRCCPDPWGTCRPWGEGRGLQEGSAGRRFWGGAFGLGLEGRSFRCKRERSRWAEAWPCGVGAGCVAGGPWAVLGSQDRLEWVFLTFLSPHPLAPQGLPGASLRLPSSPRPPVPSLQPGVGPVPG